LVAEARRLDVGFDELLVEILSSNLDPEGEGSRVY
jgi:hypothetical protein